MKTLAKFSAVTQSTSSGGICIPVPFDPDKQWGRKPRHLVSGWVNELRVRSAVIRVGSGFAIRFGPTWARDTGLVPGTTVQVTLDAEGPQRHTIDPDIAAALEADPAAGAAFDGLAQFYRKGYLTWIAGTKRRPEERARRIQEVVAWLKAGLKERPR